MLILCLAVFGLGLVGWPQPAQACCGCENKVENTLDREWWELDGGNLLGRVSTVRRTVSHAEGEFTTLKLFIAGIMWEDNILPALMLMTEQISAIAYKQVEMVGEMFDARQQLETQQIFQIESAKIHKYYQPSQGMCEFGTNVKSLAATERRSEINNLVLSQRAQDRDTGNAYSSAASGADMDKENRLAQFKADFCNIRDHGNGLDLLCDESSGPPARRNKDIDYVSTIDYPMTLNFNMNDTDLTQAEEEILALSSNLFGHEITRRAPSGSFQDGDKGRLTRLQEDFMDTRAVMAKRSVARNSFNNIVSMKASGTPGSREYLAGVLKELGVESAAEIDLLIGSDPVRGRIEPSYDLQMDILTKKLYQNPDFYTNLYDTPVNVNRKTVALQAIGLMQKFDLFKSYLRHEETVSVLLETAVMEMQERIENEINKQKKGGN